MGFSATISAWLKSTLNAVTGSAVKTVTGPIKDVSGTAKDVTGIRKDIVETKLAQIKLEEQESLRVSWCTNWRCSNCRWHRLQSGAAERRPSAVG